MKRSSFLLITGIILLLVVSTFLSLFFPLIFPDIPFDSLQKQVGEEFSPEEYMEMYNSVPYIRTAGIMISNFTGFSLLIAGIVVYVQDKRNGKPSYFSVKNGPVDIVMQTIFAFIPGLDLYASYKVKKLTKYFLIVLGIGIPVWIFLEFFAPNFLYNGLIVEGTVLPVAVYLIRKWSKKWNEQFINSQLKDDYSHSPV